MSSSNVGGFRIPRERMVERLRAHYKILDERVLDVMRRVPRHLFVPEALQGRAYGDHALPIAANQTISQPYIVARMSELLEVSAESRVLEIGAGSGYQTAVLSGLSGQVYAIERIAELAREAQARIRSLGIYNATVKCFDGTLGWSANAPYDAILVAAGGPEVPEPLLEQLKVGGRLVVPVGTSRDAQRLVRAIRTESSYEYEDHGGCAFVPLIGRFGWSNAE
ncbi:MAG TPA: protein-L-isoaspartate(D-aspartate) O-methyltransferase [Pyrinomonadaceae bacterium]|jgi:protein-L-isoaspartate(D-aspartate) O-methyltransferase|nr:protein-L-isoaspartate(D-aspartate) O-methyltransferase [Pyrinomonadaceae bacterium]